MLVCAMSANHKTEVQLCVWLAWLLVCIRTNFYGWIHQRKKSQRVPVVCVRGFNLDVKETSFMWWVVRPNRALLTHSQLTHTPIVELGWGGYIAATKRVEVANLKLTMAFFLLRISGVSLLVGIKEQKGERLFPNDGFVWCDYPVDQTALRWLTLQVVCERWAEMEKRW